MISLGGFSKLSKKSKKSSKTTSSSAGAGASFQRDLDADPVEYSLKGRGLTDGDLAGLAGLAAAKGGRLQLRLLDLSKNKLSNSCAESLVSLLQNLPLLGELRISDNRLKGAKAMKLLHKPIAMHSCLTILRLGGNELGNSGTTQVSATFQAAPNLLQVDLGWKTFTKMATGGVHSEDRLLGKPQGKDHMGPKKFIQLASKHVMISPDQRVARKMTGGDQFNSNIQWELPQVDASGCYTIAYQLHNVDHWIAVGWAPECIELDRKQYNKYGCYLTSTGFTVGPAGTPQIGIAPENRGKYMAIRMRYDPSEHTCMWHDFASGVVGELLGRFNEVSIYPPMFPTICFGHQGGQVTMLGSSRMNLRNRTASECTTSSASVLERSMMSHTSLASESEPDRSISTSTSGC